MTDPIQPSQPKPQPTAPTFIESETDDALEPLDVPALPVPEKAEFVPAAPPLPSGTKKVRRAQRDAVRDASDVDRRGRKRRYALVSFFSGLRSLIIVFATAVFVATIFATFTANDSLSAQTQLSLAIAQVTAANVQPSPTTLPTPVWFGRIGIIPGHSGINPTSNLPDPGTVCPDGFSEASVTMKVAQMITAALRARGYTVDQLDEWDPRLNGYDASVFLSIHADSCTNFDDGYPHSGFKAVNPEGRLTVRDQDLRLVDCLRNYYSQATGLSFSSWTITDNMLYYHAFHQITQRTPAAIIEIGFLYYDRDLLQNHPDKSAQGIINGLLCFLDPRSLATETPNPSATSPVKPITPSSIPSTLPPTHAPSPAPSPTKKTH